MFADVKISFSLKTSLPYEPTKGASTSTIKVQMGNKYIARTLLTTYWTTPSVSWDDFKL